MNKTYNVKRKTVLELLQDIDDFETKMINFIMKYPTYDYSININNDGNTWIGEVNITKHEKTKTT